MAGGQLPFSDNVAPAPLSSADLDEAIRREQMGRAQIPPQIPHLDGMPQPAITPPTTMNDPAQATAPGGSEIRSELGRLADASVVGQHSESGSVAADELARQVAGGTEQPAPNAQNEQVQPISQSQVQQQVTPAPPVAAAETQSQQEASSSDSVTLTSITLNAEGSDMILTLTANRRFSYKSFVLPDPDRLVIDMVGQWQGITIPNMPSNRLINRVREGKLDGAHRIVMDLKAPLAGYETTRVGENTVTVRMY
jgi:hypothetical protein